MTVPRLEKWRCPGVFREIEMRACPNCGDEIEFILQDTARSCLTCGYELTRQSSSCLSHCPARQSDCFRQLVRRQALKEIGKVRHS